MDQGLTGRRIHYGSSYLSMVLQNIPASAVLLCDFRVAKIGLRALTGAVPRRDRAKQSSCLWPSERLSPPSATCRFKPPTAVTASFTWHFSSTSHKSWSLTPPFGLKFSLTTRWISNQNRSCHFGKVVIHSRISAIQQHMQSWCLSVVFEWNLTFARIVTALLALLTRVEGS